MCLLGRQPSYYLLVYRTHVSSVQFSCVLRCRGVKTPHTAAVGRNHGEAARRFSRTPLSSPAHQRSHGLRRYDQQRGRQRRPLHPAQVRATPPAAPSVLAASESCWGLRLRRKASCPKKQDRWDHLGRPVVRVDDTSGRPGHWRRIGRPALRPKTAGRATPGQFLVARPKRCMAFLGGEGVRVRGGGGVLVLWDVHIEV